MNILFTVCGRAGSKGCKNKNIKEFLGNSLMYYTLSSIDLFIKRNKNNYNNIDICINSDSDELLDLAKKSNLKLNIVKRNIELAGDNTPKTDVIKSSAEICENNNKIKYDIVVDLDITSPLRKVSDIEAAIKNKIDNRENKVVFSVVEARRNPYFNMVINDNNNYKLVIESTYVTRQEAPSVYDMNASIYAYERVCLVDGETEKIFDGPCGIIEMNDTGVLDIDSERDFEIMQVIAKYFFEKDNELAEVKDNIENVLI
ncbi:acylneuraminate cytidylyltransferase family protein [Clostridium sp.]|uniref:acylneuraminate cytidylyltransferase family protein n=1 Tax=Clostridium sp. TaxID=1506 RepID=UPI0025BC8B26|nr:acylneuraminate cytidylyltransferase family protein [Clostridium sp.]